MAPPPNKPTATPSSGPARPGGDLRPGPSTPSSRTPERSLAGGPPRKRRKKRPPGSPEERGPASARDAALRRQDRPRRPSTPSPSRQVVEASLGASARGAEATRDLLAWLLPLLGRGAYAALRGVATATIWCARGLWSHRIGLFRASHRLMWWTALVLMALAGRALLSGHETGPLVDHAHLLFTAGLALCAFVLAFAAEHRMRMAALVLGSGHGALAALAWSLLAAA